MLWSSRHEDHMKTIGIYQSLCKRSSFEHKCFDNIKKIYQHAGKCDNQQNLKDILDADVVLTPEGVTDKSPNLPMTSTPVKKQVLENHCDHSRTYCMLKQKHQNVILELQNQNTEPWKWVIACGTRK